MTVAASFDVARAAAAAGRRGEAPPSFEALFRDHWSGVHATLVRLTGDREEAEDLALEVFLRLYHRPPSRGGPRANPAGWLYRVATHLGLNALRDRRRRRHYEDEAHKRFLEEPRSMSDPATELERSETRLQVRQTLARMKPRSAELLVLRHAGLSYAELAATLGVSPGSIGTLLARAEREFEKQHAALNDNQG